MASADLELCYLTASEALERFKARTLSPVELLDAQIARTQAVNPKLNAITYDYFDRARAQAQKAEAKYGKTDGRLRALEGVTVGMSTAPVVGVCPWRTSSTRQPAAAAVSGAGLAEPRSALVGMVTANVA